MHSLKSKDRKRPFGLSGATLRFLARTGYLGPEDFPASYSFQEMLVLRAVSELHAARIPPRRINAALRDFRHWIDAATPLARISVDVAGGIRIRDRSFSWEPGSGQYALPLERVEAALNVVPIVGHEKTMKKKHTAAHGHYLRGSALEVDDVKAARAAYESCLAGDCRHLEARINLGRLLHLEGLLEEAERIYNGHEEPSAILYFNLGILLEDLKREIDAIEAYRSAIVHDPGMADAHYNLYLVHERLGETQAAFRHLLAYRRLVHAHASTKR